MVKNALDETVLDKGLFFFFFRQGPGHMPQMHRSL
jgi:hypothetical protein